METYVYVLITRTPDQDNEYCYSINIDLGGVFTSWAGAYNAMRSINRYARCTVIKYKMNQFIRQTNKPEPIAFGYYVVDKDNPKLTIVKALGAI